MANRLIFITCAVFVFGFLSHFSGQATEPTAATFRALGLSSISSPTGTELTLWPAAEHDTPSIAKGPVETREVGQNLIAGRPYLEVHDVSRPTLTVYPAKGANTGVAILVFPGGGYKTVAIDLEGTEVCDWLTVKGITCFVLKYRVPYSGPYWDSQCKCHVTPKPTALEDAQRAVGIIRYNATNWNIDPHKIGVLGFSAGGHLVAAISTHFERRDYAPVDVADRESYRPDFAVAIYPGHLSTSDDKLELDPYIHVTREVPPTFLLQAEDDRVDDVNHSLAYYIALKNAGVPVEMHIYAKGGHAFGLRSTTQPITRWPALFETWLSTIGMTAE